MLVKHVGEKCMLAKNLYVGEELFLSSQTYSFTNIQKILHQHTYTESVLFFRIKKKVTEKNYADP